MKTLKWILALIVAAILLNTLRFKFSGAEESVYIFTSIFGEDYSALARIGSGIVELFASILILIPATRVLGALLAAGTISGAIFFHLTTLGIEVQGDGGTLFYMAILVLICSAILLVSERNKLISYVKKTS